MARTRKSQAQAHTQAQAQLVELLTLVSQLNPAEVDALKGIMSARLDKHSASAAPTAPAKKPTASKPTKAATATTKASTKPQTREEALTAKYGDKDARIAYLKSVGRYSDPSRNADFDKAWSNYVAHCQSKGVKRTKDLNRKVAVLIRQNGYKFAAKMLNA